MNKEIIKLLQKMNDGESLSRSELLRLIVYDLVEPKIFGQYSLIPAKKVNPQEDFVITTKGSELLQNASPVQ